MRKADLYTNKLMISNNLVIDIEYNKIHIAKLHKVATAKLGRYERNECSLCDFSSYNNCYRHVELLDNDRASLLYYPMCIIYKMKNKLNNAYRVSFNTYSSFSLYLSLYLVKNNVDTALVIPEALNLYNSYKLLNDKVYLDDGVYKLVKYNNKGSQCPGCHFYKDTLISGVSYTTCINMLEDDYSLISNICQVGKVLIKEK